MSRLSGLITKRIRIQKALTGLWYAIGGLTKKIRIQKTLSGILGFTGEVTAALIELTKESLAGLLTFTGELTKRIRIQKGLSGLWYATGTITKRIHVQKVLSGISGFSGSLTITLGGFFQESVEGLLSFVGTLTRRIPIQFITKAQGLGTNDPVTLSFDCGVGATFLVVCLAIRSGAASRTGTVTYAGTNMTQVGQEINSSVGVEIWYLSNPASGANDISIPNPDRNDIRVIGSSYKRVITSSPVDVSDSWSGTTDDVSNSITTTVNGDLCIDCLAHESKDLENGYNQTILYENDEGPWNSSAMYAIQSNAGSITFTHNNLNSDKWAQMLVSFKPVVEGYTLLSILSKWSGDLVKRIRIQKILDGSTNFIGAILVKFNEGTTGNLDQWIGTLIQKISIYKSLSGVLTFSGTITAFLSAELKESIGGLLNLTGTVTKRIHVQESLIGLWRATGLLTKRIRLQENIPGICKLSGNVTHTTISGMVKRTVSGSLNFRQRY
jgi:hypothetical protein